MSGVQGAARLQELGLAAAGKVHVDVLVPLQRRADGHLIARCVSAILKGLSSRLCYGFAMAPYKLDRLPSSWGALPVAP